MIEVDPARLTRVAGTWDAERHDLLAAARQLAGAPVAGFTPAVAGTAARFAGAWQRHAAGLAEAAGERADRLRRVLDDQLDTDAAQAAGLRGLPGLPGRPRRSGQVAPWSP